MAEKMVRMHGSRSSVFSNRVEIALKLKGVEYEYFEEDFPNKSQDLLKYNPIHKKIPVLVHGDKAIAESQVILEYIDEVWDSGSPIMPRDPYQRALARFWARFIDDKLTMSIYKVIWLGEEEATEEVLENMKLLDKELQGKKFFGGESIGFVDIVANFVGCWLGVMEEATGKIMVTGEAFPTFCKWRDEFLGCDIVRETLLPRDTLIARFRARLESTKGQTSN